MPESCWNNEVHSRLLNLALRGHWESKGIYYRTISAASISNKDLSPAIAASPLYKQKNMVDFALMMNPTKEAFESQKRRLNPDDLPYMNHTTAERVRFTPIAVSIETKCAAINEDTTTVQLGTWIYSHFAYLTKLTGGRHKLPALHLVAQGHEWKFLMAERQAVRVLILKDLVCGSTNTIVSIFQVISAIKRLARWIDEDFRPWFEETMYQR